MLVPPHYRSPNPALDVEVVLSNPLATLVSSAPDGIARVTEVPVIVDPGMQTTSSLEGQAIWGHLNRQNEHAQFLTNGQYAKVIVAGPRAYVSPAVYPSGNPAAPTFNFISLHIGGTIEVIDDARRVFEIVSTTASALEARHSGGWEPTASHEYFRGIMKGVRGFYLHIDRVEAMYKLSQDKDRPTRAAVERALLESDGECAAVGAFMSKHFSAFNEGVVP